MSDPFSAQLSRWAVQREQRLQLNDDLEQPRQVDHAAVFRKKAAAAAVAASFEAAGYVVSVRSGFLRTTVEASRVETLTDENVARFLRETVDIAEASGGEYDGFGGSIIQRDTAS
jgi:hypothetical protein